MCTPPIDWHMRAGAWSTNRDIAAAHLSWEHARQVADALPTDDPDRLAMRIAPRTLICGNAGWVHADISGTRFEELRQLCSQADDKASLAIGMAGLLDEHMMHARVRETWQLASEMVALIESIGDPTLTVGLAVWPIAVKIESGEMTEVLRLAQTVIDLAEGDPTKGNFVIGSPLAAALAARATARWALGRRGWRDDLDDAVTMARGTDRLSYATVIVYTYLVAIVHGVLLADDTVLRDINEALRITEGSGGDIALGYARVSAGAALLQRDSPADREHGLELLGQVRDMCLNGRYYLSELAVVDGWVAGEMARCGDRDGAVPVLRAAVTELFSRGQLGYCVPATGVLVETLLDRGTDGDVAEAEAAIEQLATAPLDEGLVIRDIWLLRMRALLARAHGDEAAYRDYRDRYREMATSLGFEGHMKWAEAMP